MSLSYGTSNRPLVTIKNNYKSRPRSKFSYIFFIFATLASTQSFCLWYLEVIYCESGLFLKTKDENLLDLGSQLRTKTSYQTDWF